MANETLKTARENCLEALAEVRKLQQELRVEKSALCRLIRTFNHLTVEGVNALTEDFVRVANECRVQLAKIEAEKVRLEAEAKAKAKAEMDAKAAYAASPAGLLEILTERVMERAEAAEARKKANQAWSTLRFAEKQLGVPSDKRTPLPTNFDRLDVETHRALADDFIAKAFRCAELAAMRQNEARQEQARVAAHKVAEETRAQTVHGALSAEYRKVHAEGNKLALKVGKRERSLIATELFSADELRVMINEMRAAINKLNKALVEQENAKAKMRRAQLLRAA